MVGPNEEKGEPAADYQKEANFMRYATTYAHFVFKNCLAMCYSRFEKTVAIVFFRQYVGLPPDMKLAMGHKLTNGTDMFGITLNGMLRTCTYRGYSCLVEE